MLGAITQYGNAMPQNLYATVNIGGEKVDSVITPIVGKSLNRNSRISKYNGK